MAASRRPRTELDHIRYCLQLLRRDRHSMVLDQRGKPFPWVILTSGLGVVWKDCREHTSLDVIATRVCRAAAEASISLQRKASLAPRTRQLRLRADADYRDTHT